MIFIYSIAKRFRGKGAAIIENISEYEEKEQHYTLIEDILTSMRQASENKSHSNEEAMKILDNIGDNE